MKQLEKNIGYTFKDKSLLKTALTHKSFINESGDKFTLCNERLEFLGDSVLGFVVADYLYKNYPEKDEGVMTKARASVVCEEGLVGIAHAWDISSKIYLSRGEEKNNGRNRHSILSDAVESIIAAVFLDGGYETAKNLILKFFADKIDSFIKDISNTVNFDYKTTLQELCQAHGITVSYELIKETGPAHDKRYTSCAVIDGKMYDAAEDTSKKKAEQKAAENAYKILSKDKKFI